MLERSEAQCQMVDLWTPWDCTKENNKLETINITTIVVGGFAYIQNSEGRPDPRTERSVVPLRIARINKIFACLIKWWDDLSDKRKQLQQSIASAYIDVVMLNFNAMLYEFHRLTFAGHAQFKSIEEADTYLPLQIRLVEQALVLHKTTKDPVWKQTNEELIKGFLVQLNRLVRGIIPTNIVYGKLDESKLRSVQRKLAKDINVKVKSQYERGSIGYPTTAQLTVKEMWEEAKKAFAPTGISLKLLNVGYKRWVLPNALEVRNHRSVIGEGLEVKPSYQDGSGPGLFATKPFATNDIVTDFEGEHVDLGTAKVLRAIGQGHYLAPLIPNAWYINGAISFNVLSGRGGGAFIHDNIHVCLSLQYERTIRCPDAPHNVKFIVAGPENATHEQLHVLAVAIAPIRAGEEILTNQIAIVW